MDEPKPFRFLDLPVELRGMIYTEILAPTGYITLKLSGLGGNCLKAYPTRFDPLQSQSSDSDDWKAERGTSLKVLRTCKLIYAEAKNVFFEKNCLELSLMEIHTETLFGPSNRDPALEDSDHAELMLLARFVSIEIGFEMQDFSNNTILWDILGASTKLEKLTLRNGQEIGGTFFCETEGSLYYASQKRRRLHVASKPLEYLSNVLDKKVQKLLNFPGMRLCPPSGLFGNEINLPKDGSALPGIAMKLHAAFGGELWVNEKMWMKDGKEMDGLDKLIEQAKEEGKALKRKHIEALEKQEEQRMRSRGPLSFSGGVFGSPLFPGMPRPM